MNQNCREELLRNTKLCVRYHLIKCNKLGSFLNVPLGFTITNLIFYGRCVGVRRWCAIVELLILCY